MRFSTVAAPLALAGLAAAAPAPAAKGLNKRNNSPRFDDATILNYALTLEHLERAFYRDSLNTYGADAFSGAGKEDYVRYRFTEIANHEKQHVDFLTAGLTAAGATPVKECEYAFGITSVDTFIATAQLLENIGVAAYLGAAPSISSKAYLAAAGSILAVEARHSTWTLSAADNQDGFPRAYEAALDFNQVFSLAAPLITSCPAGSPSLPFKAFPALTVTSTGPFKAGDEISFSTAKDVGAKYAAFVGFGETKFAPVSGTTGSITIPAGITGQTYLILTKDNKGTLDANTVAGPAVISVPVQATTFEY